MIKDIIQNVYSKRPLVHNITNYVASTDCANITLTIGASPIMADEPKEVGEVTQIADGLVLNCGTISESRLNAMLISGKTAKSREIPIVLDPVGVGISKFRTSAVHKIITEERDPGLDKINILQECLDILANPYVITQTCEDIPAQYKRQVIGLMTNLSENPKEIAEAKWELENMHTGTCPAASIEFDLATKHTAEFFRMVEGLTSPNNEVVKTIKMDSLSDKSSEAIWLLTKFKTPHQMNDFNTATVLLKPDEHAIIRARIQNHYKDPGERSIIDVLMQSTLMQLGSQQTYNSLNDKRAPNAWTQEDGGLIDFEKTYVESVVEDKNTTSVTYQIVDENGRLKGYEKDFGTIKKELLDTLKMGHNIIIGYTWPDPENDNKLAGHEITIVGYKTNSNGEGVFICQDSDDDIAAPIEMSEKFLLPKIHHAGLPDEIASRDFKYEDSWKVGLDEFQNMKKSA